LLKKYTLTNLFKGLSVNVTIEGQKHLRAAVGSNTLSAETFAKNSRRDSRGL